MTSGRDTQLVADPFGYPRYTIKRPFFSFFERTFRVFAPDGRMIMFVRHPLLKLREEFNVWADDGQTLPLLFLRARQMVAINFAYDVFDARTNAWVGTLVKQGLRSLVRDTFDILDQDGHVIGKMEEKGHSILRRFLPWLTSKHDVEIGRQCVTQIRQVFRFFIKEFRVDLGMSAGRIDPRFAVACALLALMAEARREDSR